MVRRVIRGALVAALMLPAAAGAQSIPVLDEVSWGSRVRVSPFVGWGFSQTRNEETVVLSSQGAYFEEHDVVLGSGPVVGGIADIRAYKRFSVHAGGALQLRSDTEHFVTQRPGEFFQEEGARSFMLKLGAAMHLREPESDLQLRQLAASVFVAPALVREGHSAGAMYNWGVNFGFDGDVPVTPRLTFQFGLEDTIFWWDEEELAVRANQFYALALNQVVATNVSASPGNNWMLRLGLSFDLLP
jgi:hypothetical protein